MHSSLQISLRILHCNTIEVLVKNRAFLPMRIRFTQIDMQSNDLGHYINE